MARHEIKLGKLEYKFDERTLKLAHFMAPAISYPPRFNFDSGRAPIPISSWGNDKWGNCVKVGQANQLIRLERIETRRTVKMTEADVVREYKLECQREFGTEPVFPDDQNDRGLYMLENLRNWRKEGFNLNKRNYKIFAFGELEPDDVDLLRAGIFNFTGIQFGLWLPNAAKKMLKTGELDYNGETGPEWRPGSWGGHCVYSKAYTPLHFEILTWGMKVKVSNSFMMKYCDEAWAVIDNYNSWLGHSSKRFNIEALSVALSKVASSIVI